MRYDIVDHYGACAHDGDGIPKLWIESHALEK
jgi:hypothetical protein